VFEDYSWPAKPGITPFQHQKETVKACLAFKRLFVLNDMGTGKTLSALWACDILFKAQRIKKVLIICPLSTMRSVWLEEIFYNLPHRTRAIAHGSKDVRRAVIAGQYDFTIINHDGVSSVYEELCKGGFDIIIIDELTAYKTFQAERTKKMIMLARTVKAVWGLTGKPTPNSPIEAFSQGHVVNPANPNLPRYFTQFREMVLYRLNMYTWVPRPEATNIVASILQPAIRYKLEDCIDMPPLVYHTMEIPFTKAQEKAYVEMKEHLYTELSNGEVSAANAAVKLNKLLQISAGAVKTDDGEPQIIDCSPRLEALYQLLEETPQRKMIVFVTFRASINLVVNYLRDKGVSTKFIYGDVSPQKRQEAIHEFQTSNLEVLVIQPQSSAHGITLTAASTIVWFSLIPSNELYQQGNARIYRAGQTLPCLIVHMVSSGAEKHIAKLLTRKEAQASSVLELIKGHEL
jgi:SNF2 family DNA or RNA helicase